MRKAKALSLKGDQEEADEQLDAALQLDPGLATEVEKERGVNRQRRKAAEAKMRKGFGGFFKTPAGGGGGGGQGA